MSWDGHLQNGDFRTYLVGEAGKTSRKSSEVSHGVAVLLYSVPPCSTVPHHGTITRPSSTNMERLDGF